jgi:PEP-CTERM motif
VDGNATDTTPNGFTLFRGSVAGAYVWTASYTNSNDEISSLEPVSVGSVGSVPEPSTWMMMGLGFAGLGFVAFRRSEKGDASTVLV